MQQPVIHVLGGGAAQGVFERLKPEFERLAGASLHGTFGAVGAMRERLVAGAPCDVAVLSATLIRQLESEGLLRPASARSLGHVATGVAVPAGSPLPTIGTSAAWRDALAACTGLYVPDLTRSTAGQHVAAMLDALGLRQALQGRLHEFANGQTAMAALAASGGPGALGCTQVTEILNTPGATLVGALPAPHALSTEYSAAVTATSAHPSLAARLVKQLCEPAQAARRRARGLQT